MSNNNRNKKTAGTVVAAAVLAAAALATSACAPLTDSNYHGTVSGAATVSPVSSTRSVPAAPVTVTGNGEQVASAALVATGYTVSYQATSFCLIVQPVETDGSDGISIVNECAFDNMNGPVSGTTTYRGTGRTTLHVSNTQGPWSLTFTPLS